MPPASRRLPEDSVVASLSEIQAILRTGETRAVRPTPQVAATTDIASPATQPGAPVPSAAELRVTREARWAEEMLDANRVGQGAPAGRRFRGWVLGAGLVVAFVGAGAAYVTSLPPPAGEGSALVVASAAVTPSAPSVVAVTPISAAAEPSPAMVAPTTFAGAPPVRNTAKAGPRREGRGQKAVRSRGDHLDSVLGPRQTASNARPKARNSPRSKGKKTRADAQLDSVLDSL